MTATASHIQTLEESECWDLLASESIGRLAIGTDQGPDMFVLTYLVSEGAVFFRSAPGTKLTELTANPLVAFEADGIRDGHRWSVVVRGTAHRIDADDVIEESGIMGLPAAASGEKWNYVRIQPGTVSGRRV